MNLWKSFDRLTATTGPLYIGEVIDINASFGDPRCTVSLLPGGVELEVVAPGRTLALGQRWLIQDGQVIGEASTGDVVYLDI